MKPRRKKTTRSVRIPKTSEKEFFNLLKKREFEHIPTIKQVEKLLMKERGFVFKMPKPGAPVVLLVSGGLDSVITWEILLSKYKLSVFPLFIFRDRKRSFKEKKSAEFFSSYFKKKYPSLHNPVEYYSTIVSPPEITKQMKKQKMDYYHPQRILEMIAKDTLPSGPNFYPQRILPFLHLFYGLVYSDYLYDRKNLKIRTIFTAILVGDGEVVPSQTFTSLRSALLSAIHVTANHDWQYASLTFEKELGHYLYKKDLIKIGAKLGLPLEKTWTCYKSKKYQCGECLTCMNRRDSFKEIGITDKTVYHKSVSETKEELKKKISKLPFGHKIIKFVPRLKLFFKN